MHTLLLAFPSVKEKSGSPKPLPPQSLLDTKCFSPERSCPRPCMALWLGGGVRDLRTPKRIGGAVRCTRVRARLCSGVWACTRVCGVCWKGCLKRIGEGQRPLRCGLFLERPDHSFISHFSRAPDRGGQPRAAAELVRGRRAAGLQGIPGMLMVCLSGGCTAQWGWELLCGHLLRLRKSHSNSVSRMEPFFF